MTIQIFDTEAFKLRQVKNVRVARHEIPSEEDGKMISVKVVEFVVVGANNEWKHFLPYEDFVRANEHVGLEE